MKLSKYSMKKVPLTTDKKRSLMSNKSMENIKISDYTTVEKEDELNLYQIALEEYKDLFPEIIILSKKDFFTSLEKYIQINLATSDKIFPKGVLQKMLNLIDKKYYTEEKIKINKKLKNLEFKENINKNFIPHCLNNKKMLHSCGNKLLFIDDKYLYCDICKLIYKSDNILLKCDNCDINFYTEIIEKSEEKRIYKPATWSKYHCNALINDTMKCQKCKNCLYLDINNKKNNILYCLKCNIELNPYEIKWKCVLCNSPFFSEAKIYNKYELKNMLLAIKKTLFKGIEAKPKYLPCCNIYGDKVKSYKYIHKNECNGILYEGELNNKKIIVCSKCHMLNYYENQFWLCPICKVRFHLKKNISPAEPQNYQNMETINNINNDKNKIEIYHHRKRSELSIEIKKNIFEICKEREKENDNKDISIDKSLINEYNSKIKKKKIYSVRNKPKKMNFYNSYYYNNNERILDNIGDNSHIIYSNSKKVDRFQTIQDNEENKKFIMTNYKQNKNIITNNNISRNLKMKNIKRTPSQIIQNKIINPINLFNGSDIKDNYSNFNNKKSQMNKNVRVRSSLEQNPILQTCDDIKIDINNIKSNKKVMKFDRNNIIYSNNKKEGRLFNNNNKKEKEVKIILKESDNILKEIEKEREQKLKQKNINSLKEVIKNNFNSDDYNIIRQIGQGSFGKIFEVEDKYHNHYALKKIIAYSMKEVEIIKAEYNILYDLQELKIDLITIYGLETRKLDRTTYAINVLMELAICDWEQEIKKRYNLKNYYTEKELIIILKNLVKTFSLLQKANVSHRDIKPQNILLCKDKDDNNKNLNLKIADFGEAKKMINKNDNNNTIKQTIRGTELYMSPILFNSLRNKMVYKYTKHNTFKSDVFSLGYCLVLASTLSYKLLCEIRELKNMKDIEKMIEKYNNKGIGFYSKKYWNIIFSMLQLDEKYRPDFIELEKIVEEL